MRGKITGSSVWLIDTVKLINDIKSEYPRISEVRINRTYPDKIKIRIRERTPVAIIDDNGVPVAIDVGENRFAPTAAEAGELTIIVDYKKGDIKSAAKFINYISASKKEALGDIDYIKIEGEEIATFMTDSSSIFWGKIESASDFEFKLNSLEIISNDAKKRYQGIKRIDLSDVKKNKRAVVLPITKKI